MVCFDVLRAASGLLDTGWAVFGSALRLKCLHVSWIIVRLQLFLCVYVERDATS